MYTLEDLQAAQTELELWEGRWERYDGNNPNKYQADIKNARSLVRNITESLKDIGLLERNEQENLDARLDKEFPNAQSKQIVEFEGKKYQRCFFPLRKSCSRKSVVEWGKSWDLVG
ncbi:conserved hypothetical protein [Vibrio crassostreae]|uniref:hypothetical protein n=1 Tax=Vibrio crassostreae TaxID=246167 RepID=UPI0010455D1A|nr:hypothetical protein [Vibrio crassostreae]TCN74092.1 hypothetical protein EDB62_12216 [Vibrio crassostreae]TWD63912.1 hypothetical protein FB445_12236 [Vibrio crassostreae]CAK2039539.1 conserved hypothetical protein [Vibrio crassostreae]CAK2106167.1 conserved hypothetical protein [Vibrio crassostreae]CAK2823301.1 conserved hypothetical protein [Vibrio crassostreae]